MPLFGAGSDDEEGASPLGLIVAALLAALAAGLLQMALSRSREFAVWAATPNRAARAATVRPSST